MKKSSSRATDAKHRLLFELGRGGMGTVYLAVTEGPAGFSKLKVVKQLHADLAGDVEFLNMFLDEARLAARLNHPNIVQTTEIGFDGRSYFIEMEYLDGQPLEAIFRRNARSGGAPLTSCVWILGQVLAGLHHAHEAKDRNGEPLRIVHRDVSPHNVFVTYEGTVKLLDFGIAKAADSSAETRTGVVKGKATYMAPEQVLRRPVDRRADVFAVGVILWQVMTGRRIWEGLNDLEILTQLQTETMPEPKSVAPDVDAALNGICAKALARDARDRWETAEEMQNALEQWLDDRGAKVGPRAIGRWVAELFAERRAAVQAEIDTQLRDVADDTASQATSAQVPRLADTRGFQLTTTGDVPSEAPPTITERTSAASPVGKRASRAETPTVTPERTRTTPGVASEAPPPPARVGPRALVIGAASLAALVAIGASLTASRSRAGAATGAPARSASSATIASSSSTASSAGVVPARLACRANADCAGESPAVCRHERCVSLVHPGCHVMGEKDSLTDERTMWFGGMFALTRDDADEIGKVYERGVAVAREDFARVSSGLPSSDGFGPPHPIAVMSCDDTKDPDAIASYLADELEVPAILGFGTSAEVLDVGPHVLIPKKVVGMVVADGSPLIAAIPEPPGKRYLWRTTLTSLQEAPAAAAITAQLLEPSLRASGSLKPGEALRLAWMRRDDAQGMSLSDVLLGALRFNGKSAFENGHDFREIVFPEDDDAERDGRAVEALRALAPHVILFEGGDEMVRRFFAPLESTRGGPHPYYVSCSNLGGEALDALLVKMPPLRSRIFGMYGPLNTPNNLRFTLRYNEGLDKPLPYTMTPSASYDGFYALAYAAYLALLKGEARPTGASIADAILELQPVGARFAVGPSSILDALDALRRGHHIDLDGASSSLDFETATGDVTADMVLQCMRPIPRATGFEPQEIPVAFSAGDRKWRGAIRCP